MSMIPFKSAKLRNAAKGALGTVAAASLLFAALPSSAADAKIGETTINFSGYVKLDVVYGFGDLKNDAAASASPTSIDLGSDDGDGEFGWTARQTRLGISTTTPTAIGDIHGYIELDMYGAPGGLTQGGSPRLRLAYLKYGNWTFGRTYSLYSNFTYSSPIEFGGPVGYTFDRMESIRYTFDLGNGSLAVALEENTNGHAKGGPYHLVGTVFQAPGGPVQARVDNDGGSNLPRLTTKWTGSIGMANFLLAGVLAQQEDVNASGDTKSTMAWGLASGVALSFQSGTTVKLAANYTEGTGLMVGVAPYNARFDASGDLYTTSQLGLIATLKQQFTPQFSGSIVYSYANWQDEELDTEVTGTDLTLNLVYSPVDPLLFGVSFAHYTIDDQAGAVQGDDSANRMQFSAMYTF